MRSTLLVFAGYIAAEILLGGYAAALAVFLLGLLEYLFFLAIRKEDHPSLIIEGTVLAGIVIGGELLSSAGYSGAEIVLLELVLGAVLLISALLGRPWLASQMRRLAGFSAGRDFAIEASSVMGALFLAHGLLAAAAMLITGSVPVLPAVLVFAILYAAAVLSMRRKQRRRARKSMPGLSVDPGGKAVLDVGGRKLGTMEIRQAPVSIVSSVEIFEGIEERDFLEQLEEYLRAIGCRALRLSEWSGEDLTLEMSGYRRTGTGWSKPLR